MYATKTEVATYLGTLASLPTDIERLINRAGEQVYSYIKRNYDSTNADHVLAMKKATCAQVEYFINCTENAAISGNTVSSFSGGSVSISFKDLKTGSVLSPRAKQYLNDAYLLYRGLNHIMNGERDWE